MGQMKVGTCCYCGSRAALSLRGQTRHELACSTCGAPLSRMKMLPKQPEQATARAATPARPEPYKAHRGDGYAKPSKSRKRKKSKGFGRKVFEELWDVVEDIFD